MNVARRTLLRNLGASVVTRERGVVEDKGGVTVEKGSSLEARFVAASS